MSATRRRISLYLIGFTDIKFGEANFCQMAKTFFFHHTDLKKFVHDAVVATTDNEVPFWESARILLRAKQYLIAI